jgi:N-acetylmuramoyl-L-alanine amidase
MKTVLISAGHSNTDPGAVNGKFREADFTLKIRNAVAEELTKLGQDFIEDGGTDPVKVDTTNQPLSEAVKLERQVAGTRVEFHLNASTSPNATGIEALALAKHKSQSKRLAKAVQQALNLKLRGEEGWKSQSSGQHKKLAFCSNGGIVLEVCFISNLNDMEKLIDRMDVLAQNLAATLHAMNK